jgi:SAM-dependent methyltransferase
MNNDNKFSLQESEYSFPYHYLPKFNKDEIPTLSRFLGWGMEYLCYTRQIVDFVLELAPESLLDVGCGDGRFLSLLGDSVNRKLGCDLSERAIVLAKAMNSTLDYRCVDVADIDGSFDVVTAIEVLEHVPEEAIKSFVTKLFDRVKHGSFLIVCVPSTAMKLQPKHYRHYDESLLDNHISLSDVKFEKINSVRVFRRRDIIYNLYLRLTLNKIYKIEIPILNKIIWKYIWMNRFSKERGLHIISIYRKN